MTTKLEVGISITDQHCGTGWTLGLNLRNELDHKEANRCDYLESQKKCLLQSIAISYCTEYWFGQHSCDRQDCVDHPHNHTGKPKLTGIDWQEWNYRCCA